MRILRKGDRVFIFYAGARPEEPEMDPKKERMILVLNNMRRLGSRSERETIDEIIELIENS